MNSSMLNYTLHIDFSKTSLQGCIFKGLRQDGGLQCDKDQLPEKEALIYNEQTGLEFSWVEVGGFQTHTLYAEVFLLAF